MVQKIKRKKIYKKHALKRVIERTDINLKELEDRVKHKTFLFISKQSHTRSLCVAKIRTSVIWFILRKPDIIVTIIPHENKRVQKLSKLSYIKAYLGVS